MMVRMIYNYDNRKPCEKVVFNNIMMLRIMMIMIMIMTYGKKYLTTKSMLRAY
jgi:hypothetical protein